MVPHPVGNREPQLTYGSLSPMSSAPQTAYQSVQSFRRVHGHNQRTDRQTDGRTDDAACVMPNSHGPPYTTRPCSLCRVRRCELSRSDRHTSAFCVGVRPAVAPAVSAPPNTLRRRTHLSGGQADSIHTVTPDTTRRSCLCRVWCAGVNWTIALNVFRL